MTAVTGRPGRAAGAPPGIAPGAPRRRKLPARYHGFAMPLVLSVLMSCIVSSMATLHTTGLAAGFLRRWMGAWGTSWLIGFPTLLAVLPVVRRVVHWIVESPESSKPGRRLHRAGRAGADCPSPCARVA